MTSSTTNTPRSTRSSAAVAVVLPGESIGTAEGSFLDDGLNAGSKHKRPLSMSSPQLRSSKRMRNGVELGFKPSVAVIPAPSGSFEDGMPSSRLSRRRSTKELLPQPIDSPRPRRTSVASSAAPHTPSNRRSSDTGAQEVSESKSQRPQRKVKRVSSYYKKKHLDPEYESQTENEPDIEDNNAGSDDDLSIEESVRASRGSGKDNRNDTTIMDEAEDRGDIDTHALNDHLLYVVHVQDRHNNRLNVEKKRLQTQLEDFEGVREEGASFREQAEAKMKSKDDEIHTLKAEANNLLQQKTDLDKQVKELSESRDRLKQSLDNGQNLMTEQEAELAENKKKHLNELEAARKEHELRLTRDKEILETREAELKKRELELEAMKDLLDSERRRFDSQAPPRPIERSPIKIQTVFPRSTAEEMSPRRGTETPKSATQFSRAAEENRVLRAKINSLDSELVKAKAEAKTWLDQVHLLKNKSSRLTNRLSLVDQPMSRELEELKIAYAENTASFQRQLKALQGSRSALEHERDSLATQYRNEKANSGEQIKRLREEKAALQQKLDSQAQSTGIRMIEILERLQTDSSVPDVKDGTDEDVAMLDPSKRSSSPLPPVTMNLKGKATTSPPSPSEPSSSTQSSPRTTRLHPPNPEVVNDLVTQISRLQKELDQKKARSADLTKTLAGKTRSQYTQAGTQTHIVSISVGKPPLVQQLKKDLAARKDQHSKLAHEHAELLRQHQTFVTESHTRHLPLQLEISRLREENNAVHRQLLEVQRGVAINAANSPQMKKIEHELALFRSENVTLRNDTRKMEHELALFKSENVNLKNEISKLSSQKGGLMAEIKRVKTINDSLRNQSKFSGPETSHLRDQIQNLTVQRDNLKLELSELKFASIEQNDGSPGRDQASLKMVRSGVPIGGTASELEKEVLVLREQLALAKSDTASQSAAFERVRLDLKEKLERTKQERDSLIGRSSHKSASMPPQGFSPHQSRPSSSSSSESLMTENEALRRQLEAMQRASREAASLRRDHAELITQVESLKTQVQSKEASSSGNTMLQQECIILRRQYDETAAKLKDSNDILESAMEECRNFASLHKTIQSENQELKATLEHYGKSIEDLNSENSELLKMNALSKEDLKAKYNELQTVNAQLQSIKREHTLLAESAGTSGPKVLKKEYDHLSKTHQELMAKAKLLCEECKPKFGGESYQDANGLDWLT